MGILMNRIIILTLGLTIAAALTGSTQASDQSASTAKPFDPFTRPVTVGWLPAGLLHATTRTGGDQYYARYTHEENPQPDVWNLTEVEIRVWPVGSPPSGTVPPSKIDSADVVQVGEKTARWVPHEGGTGGVLRWEYQPGGWAEVQARGVPSVPLQTVQQVAESIRFGASERIRLPWRLTGIPSDLVVKHLQVVDLTTYRQPPARGWHAEIVFGKRDVDEPMLIVRAGKGPGGGFPDNLPNPNTTVHGQPAELKHSRDGSEVLIISCPDHVFHSLHATSKALAQLQPDGLAGLAEHFDLLGDEATWTQQPLP